MASSPINIEPTGHPKPLLKHTEIVSNKLPYCFAVSCFATKAFHKRAPSR